MRFEPRRCSHIAILVKALEMVEGPVLELGTGVYSTAFLHWMCIENNRLLVSYENDEKYYKIAKKCEERNPHHKVILVDDWEDADIEKPWGIVLVDHVPAMRRKEEVKRLASYAQCIVIHDSQWKADKHYHYKEIYPLFKYRYDYTKVKPHTTVLSNFVDVTKWWPEVKQNEV